MRSNRRRIFQCIRHAYDLFCGCACARADNGEESLKALVTDASYLHTLGIVRCLGKRGIDVYALGEHGTDLSFHSRYCREGIIGPSPKEDKYVGFLVQTLKSRKIDTLIPVGYWSTETIARNRTRLDPLTHIELAKYESIRLAASKKRTYEMAERLGIPHPTTIYPRTFVEVREISRNLEYPVVIKPLDEGYSSVLYPRNPRELSEKYHEMCKRNRIPENSLPMIQEYIIADSTFSFSALYQDGVCKRIFMWKETRSYPITGGSSTFSESIYDSELKEYGLKLLDELNWHGVAHVEFKLDGKDNKLKLMEINPKFWASLDVALQAGVDFPFLVCEIANGVRLKYSEQYDRCMRFHWPLSQELKHIMQRPSSIPKVLADTFNPKVKSNIQLDDLAPHLLEFVTTLTVLITRTRLLH